MNAPIYKCATKATSAEGENLRHSFSWIVSQRTTLKIHADALEFGNNRIPYDSIKEAILFSTRQMLIPCYVLRISVDGTIYQFGLNPNAFWKGELPFPVTREKMRLQYSWFSIIIRIFFWCCLGFLLWRKFG